jgi:hypothetical protein
MRGAKWATFMNIISSAAIERSWDAPATKEFLDLLATRFRGEVVEKP